MRSVPADEVSTESGSDRVSAESRTYDPAATALGIDFIPSEFNEERVGDLY